MRVSAPDVTLEPERVVATALFESGAGRFEPVAVRLSAPRELAGHIDVTSTPFVPVAAVVAAASGEDLELDGPVSPAVAAGAQWVTAVMSDWWRDEGWAAPVIRSPDAASTPPAGGHGLFFSLGVDSWASLLALRPATNGVPPLTHLLTVLGTELPRGPQAEAEVLASMHRVAEAMGLPLVELETNARDLLDQVAPWEQSHGSVLAAFGLLLGPLLGRVTIAGSHGDIDRPRWGSHIELDHRWSSESTEFVHHLGHATRTEKVAMVSANQLALDTLLVCWESGEARNCGHCPKCLRTMTALELVGALGRSAAFSPEVDPESVRATSHADSAVFVRELLAQLPPGELRAAWESHLPATRGVRRIVAPATTAMAGPGLLDRVRGVLEGTGWRAEPNTSEHDPSDLPARPDDDCLVVGWEPEMVALRPPSAAIRDVLATIATHQARPIGWMVADLADPQRVNDHWASAVADAAERAWGPGICYLGGIGWARTADPVLGPDAVGRLFEQARLRLWWSEEATLDPLRVVESVEHGCLPLQVMPDAAAGSLQRRLPDELAPLVVSIDALAALDVSPAATFARLTRAAEVVLAGSVERDIAWDAAFRHDSDNNGNGNGRARVAADA